MLINPSLAVPWLLIALPAIQNFVTKQKLSWNILSSDKEILILLHN